MQTNKNRQLRQRNGENRRHRKKQLRFPHIQDQTNTHNQIKTISKITY